MGAWTPEEQLTFDIAFAAQPLDLLPAKARVRQRRTPP